MNWPVSFRVQTIYHIVSYRIVSLSRKIGRTCYLYPTPSEIFTNPFKNSGLAYT